MKGIADTLSEIVSVDVKKMAGYFPSLLVTLGVAQSTVVALSQLGRRHPILGCNWC